MRQRPRHWRWWRRNGLWLWRGDRKRGDVDGCKQWDVVWDLDSVWPVGGVEGDGIEALRMGSTSGETVLAPIGR